MSCSLKAGTSTLPYPSAGIAASDASDDPGDQTRLVCFSALAISSQVKYMKGIQKRIEKRLWSLARSPVAASTAEGHTTPVDEGMAGSWPDDNSESGYATPVEELSDTFPDSSTGSVCKRPEEARTSTFSAKPASDDPPPRASISFEAALAQMKTRNSEIRVSKTAVDSRTSLKEASMSFEATFAQMNVRNLSVRGPVTEECVGSNSKIYSTDSGSSLDKCSAGRGDDAPKYVRRYIRKYLVCGSLDFQRHPTCATSDSRRNSSFDVPKSGPKYESTGGKLDSCRSSTLATADSRRTSSFTVPNSPRYESTGGKLDSWRSSAHATADSRRNSSFTVSDLPKYKSTGGKLDSWRSSTLATADSRRNSSSTVPNSPRYESIGETLDSWRSSTHATADSRRNPSSTVSDSPRYKSTGGRLDSCRSSTLATPDSRRNSRFTGSDLPRYESTVGKLDSQRSYSTYGATSDARRYSTGTREVPAPTSSKKSLLSPVYCVKSLLNPSTSVETFLSLVCTEETLVSTYDSRVPLGAQKSMRSSPEILLQPGLSKKIFNSTDNLDGSNIPTGSENAAYQNQDKYSNSNISWSKPLEREPPLKVDSLKIEERRPSTSERSPPIDHLAIYVGSERKKLFISSQVFKHQLFKQLLNSHHYKVEQRDGNSAVVLTCDIDYFRRLLFFVDQRPEEIR